MQNCLNFSVDRSTKAKHATHPHPGPPLAPRDSVAAGDKKEGENLPPARQHCPKFRQQMDSRLRGNYNPGVPTRTVSSGPLRGAEQRRGAGGFRLALSEPQASLASRPDHRVAQGTGVAGTDPGVAFSLATFFWRSKRKYARASSAENTAKRSQKTPHPHPGPALAPRDSVATGHKREGENHSLSHRPCPKFRHQMDSRLRGNDGATVSDWLVSPAPLRGTPQ
jgi:hypothetical protein